jgi:hypothetical protein
MDPMLCDSDLDATVCVQPKFAASEHLLPVLEPDMALQSSPPRASWASGLMADEQAQHQQLSVGALQQRP